MEKILKAMLRGLVLSIVLCSPSSSVFLKDVALWTFQSNVGRVDVAFAGSVQNGYLEVRGDNVRAYKPKWLLDNRHNQGDMILFPVSYLKRTYEITLKPQGNAKEMSLIMNFRGSNLMVDGKRKPAYVRFENIRINGKIIAEGQTVWHDEPFGYNITNISDNTSVTLSFEIRKPISFADIRWNRVMGLFIFPQRVTDSSEMHRDSGHLHRICHSSLQQRFFIVNKLLNNNDRVSLSPAALERSSVIVLVTHTHEV